MHELVYILQEVNRLIMEMEVRERENLNNVLLEERRWYSGFVAGFSKSLVSGGVEYWCLW